MAVKEAEQKGLWETDCPGPLSTDIVYLEQGRAMLKSMSSRPGQHRQQVAFRSGSPFDSISSIEPDKEMMLEGKADSNKQMKGSLKVTPLSSRSES